MLRPGDGLALGCAGLIAGSAVALWLLHRPASRLCRWLNGEAACPPWATCCD